MKKSTVLFIYFICFTLCLILAACNGVRVTSDSLKIASGEKSFSADTMPAIMVKALNKLPGGGVYNVVTYVTDSPDAPHTFLIHYKDTISKQFTSADLDFDVAGSAGTVSFSTPIIPFESHFALLKLGIHSGGKISLDENSAKSNPFLFFTSPSLPFEKAVVQNGYLEFGPGGSGLDLRGARIRLYTQSSDHSYKYQEELTVIQAPDGEWRRCDLKDQTLYLGSEVEISGVISVNPSSTAQVELKAVPNITLLSSVEIPLGASQGNQDIVVLNFAGEDGELARWLYEAAFSRFGLEFISSEPISGLENFQLTLRDNRNAVVLGMENHGGETIPEKDQVRINYVMRDQSLKIANQTTGVRLIDTIKASLLWKSGPVNTLVFYNVNPGEVKKVTLRPELIFGIKKAVIKPSAIALARFGYQFPLGEYPYTAGPGGDNIAKPLNIKDYTGDIDKYFNPAKLELVGPKLYMYTGYQNELFRNGSARLYASPKSGSAIYLAGNPSARASFSLGGVVPVFSGNKYTGTMPPPLLAVNEDALQQLFRLQPEEFLIKYDFDLTKDVVELKLEEENTIAFDFDVVLELPMNFKIFEDTPGAGYATMHFDDVMDRNGVDAFNRKTRWDPIVKNLDLDIITLQIDYDNNLGSYNAQIYLVDALDKNYRKPLCVLEDGSRRHTVQLDPDTLPWPFIPGIEIRFPVTANDPVSGNYAALVMRRNGGFNVNLKITSSASASLKNALGDGY